MIPYQDIYSLLDTYMPKYISEEHISELAKRVYQEYNRYYDLSDYTWNYLDELRDIYESISYIRFYPIQHENPVQYPIQRYNPQFSDYHSSKHLTMIHVPKLISYSMHDINPLFYQHENYLHNQNQLHTIKNTLQLIQQLKTKQVAGVPTLRPFYVATSKQLKRIRLLSSISSINEINVRTISYPQFHYKEMDIENQINIPVIRPKFIKPIHTKLVSIPPVRDWRSFKILPIQPFKHIKHVKKIQKNHREFSQFDDLKVPTIDVPTIINPSVLLPLDREPIEEFNLMIRNRINRLSMQIERVAAEYNNIMSIDYEAIEDGDCVFKSKLMTDTLYLEILDSAIDTLYQDTDALYPIEPEEFDKHATDELSNEITKTVHTEYHWANIWSSWLITMNRYRVPKETEKKYKAQYESNENAFNLITKYDDSITQTIDESVSENLTADMFL